MLRRMCSGTCAVPYLQGMLLQAVHGLRSGSSSRCRDGRCMHDAVYFHPLLCAAAGSICRCMRLAHEICRADHAGGAGA
jgi:hypothetical protein